MLTASSVDIDTPDVEGARGVIAAFLERTCCPGKLDSLAATFWTTSESARALLPDDREGDLQRHVKNTLGAATPNIHCLRTVVDEYLQKRRRSRSPALTSG